MTSSEQIQQLTETMQRMEKRITILEDTQAIRCLQHAYGYYIDKCLYDEVVDLYSGQGEVRFMGGIFKGKAGVRRLYCDRFRAHFTGGKNGPVFGFLLDHPQLQDIVHIAPEGNIAYGRFRALMQAGRHQSAATEKLPVQQWWEGGQYENTYIKEDGVWKIKVLDYHPQWHADFETGWAHTRPAYVAFYTEADLYPGNPVGPDALMDPKPVLWPETEVVPFHYPHPVRGHKQERPKAKTAA
jgi:carotenoid cleavage dioxygenase